MIRLVCLIIGYFFGCIQPSFIIGKVIYKIDIREQGSGNAGATNTSRVLGKKVGIIVAIIDLSKAMVAYLFCSYIFNGYGTFTPEGTNMVAGMYAGLGVVIGHNFPFYMNFKGGKGIACSFGMMLTLNPFIFGIGTIVFFASLIITNYVSLTALITLLVPIILTIVFNMDKEITLICTFLLALACYQHRENIKRLLNKTERKFRGVVK